MTIIFFFFCSFFPFSRSHGLFIPGNNACHRWPSRLKHHFLWENCFEKGWLLVQGCSYQFCPKKGLWLKKCSRKMGNFWSTCPKTLIKVIPGYHDLGILFCSLKRFEAIASLDAYQITNYQFLQKFNFYTAWFPTNSRKSLWVRNFLACCLSRQDQKVYSIFQNRAPWGTTFLFKRFHGERKCLLGWVHY